MAHKTSTAKPSTTGKHETEKELPPLEAGCSVDDRSGFLWSLIHPKEHVQLRNVNVYNNHRGPILSLTGGPS